MIVPEDVRMLLGQNVLTQSLATTDPHTAAVKARPILREWRDMIAAARQGSIASWGADTEVRRLAEVYRQAIKNGDDYAVDEHREDIIDYVLKHYPPSGADVRLVAHQEHRGDVYVALQHMKGGKEATQMLDKLMDTSTPLDTLIPAWEQQLRTRMAPRNVGMYLSDARKFCADTGARVEALTRQQVQAWCVAQLDAGQITSATLTRKLASLRSLWKFAQERNIADAERDPFRALVRSRQGGKAPTKRAHFNAADVGQLWQQAVKVPALQALIILGAYTGARIEELCQLRRGHVDMEKGVLTVPGTKTEAAAREVPIHPDVAPVIRALMERSQDGFLILSTSKVSHGARSSALSKQFGRLKTRLGHPKARVFHSLRKTVTTLLEQGGCPEGIAADIVGHEKKTITYGLYSGGTSMEQRRAEMEKALVYPERPPVPGGVRKALRGPGRGRKDVAEADGGRRAREA